MKHDTPNFPHVLLTGAEMITAGTVGIRRRVQNIINGRGPTHGSKHSADAGALDNDIVGCMAEFAVAKYFNLYWSGTIGELEAPDVGGLIEVRMVRERIHRLRLHPEDKQQFPYVLALAELPRIWLLGYCWWKDGAIAANWSDPSGCDRPAFFVPNPLSHVDELKVWIRGARTPSTERTA
jgi:hypothetical protein